MHKLVAAIILANIFGGAMASDKDILREACSGLKQASKRSQCFDAIDHLAAPTQSEVLSSPRPVEIPYAYSDRGMSCLAFEFSELEKMSSVELTSLYCSYSRGTEISDSVTKDRVEKEANPRVKIALLDLHIGTLTKCGNGMSKVKEQFKRKYADQKIDCEKMPKPKQSSDT